MSASEGLNRSGNVKRNSARQVVIEEVVPLTKSKSNNLIEDLKPVKRRPRPLSSNLTTDPLYKKESSIPLHSLCLSINRKEDTKIWNVNLNSLPKLPPKNTQIIFEDVENKDDNNNKNREIPLFLYELVEYLRENGGKKNKNLPDNILIIYYNI